MPAVRASLVVAIACGVACDADPADSTAAEEPAADPIDCAAVVRSIMIPGPLIYSTPHFLIEYQRPGDPDAPAPDCTSAAGDACYRGVVRRRPDVPDLVEDLGFYFERAYGMLAARGYAVRPAGRLPILVRSIDTTGQFVISGPCIAIHPNLRGDLRAQWVRQLALHELVHDVQYRAYTSAPPAPGTDPIAGWYHNKWLLEATATALEVELTAPPGLFRIPWFDSVMTLFPLDDSGGYEAFAFVRYAKRHGIDLPRRLFGRTRPGFTQADVPASGSSLALLDRVLAAAVPQHARRLALWAHFSYALHHARSERDIPGIRSLLEPSAPPSEELDRAPTGLEREAPLDGEEPPLAQNALIIDSSEPLLEVGRAHSFRIDLRRVLCDRPGAPIRSTSYRCHGRRELAQLVLDVARPEAAYVAVYRARGTGAPAVLASAMGSTPRRIAIDLELLRAGDDVVVSIVHDPEAPETLDKVRLSVFFQPR